ncbi:MAG TPA: universal stress protein [Planctomycetota bacterium]|nr:universal stress protein [Planctomycetota bacterium]
MKTISKILVPVDFSTCSKQALEYAVELAERYTGSSIDVLHVWEPPRYIPLSTQVTTNGTTTSIEGAARVQALKDMENLIADHESRGIVKFTRLHECGEHVPTILETARRGKYDLIVMGTHGRTGMAHDYLGSVAEKVVRRAPCPVLTIRERKPAPAEAPVAAETATK